MLGNSSTLLVKLNNQYNSLSPSTRAFAGGICPQSKHYPWQASPNYFRRTDFATSYAVPFLVQPVIHAGRDEVRSARQFDVVGIRQRERIHRPLGRQQQRHAGVGPAIERRDGL